MDSDFLPPPTAPDAIYHVLSGSFSSLSLALLAFSPVNRTLTHIKTVPGFGPHQYLALNAIKDVVYTTSWAAPPTLSSWKLQRSFEGRVVDVKPMNTVQITATSSYISFPPPHEFVYSAGGPTGEVHELNPDGSIGEKIQEFLFIPSDELESADKSRVALRYGSHGIEFSSSGYAFVPVLGSSTIVMYRRDPITGLLEHISSSSSPRGSSSHDGPRHVKVHPNGKVLYCVTEHTNYLDSYEIGEGELRHLTSHSIIPSNIAATTAAESAADDPHLRSKLRGGTLMLTPSSPSFPAPIALFTTTRGATSAENGWLSIFKLDRSGRVIASQGEPTDAQTPLERREDHVIRFKTPTSSGKANALDIRSKDGDDPSGFWVLLTDDDRKADESGAIRALEWNGWGGDEDIRMVAEWPRSIETRGIGKKSEKDDHAAAADPDFLGASHALWLD